MDELEAYLRKFRDARRHFVVEARSASPTSPAAANLEFERMTFVGGPFAEMGGRLLMVKGHDLRVDEAELSGLGWTKTVPGYSDASGQRYTFRRREPAPEDAAGLAADVRVVAAALIGGDVILSVPMASAAARRRVKRDEAGETVGFAFGMFFSVLPISALLTAGVGAASRFVTPLEAVVALGLTMVLVQAVLRTDRGSGVGQRLVTVLLGGVTAVVRAFAPVPVLGTIVTIGGATLVVWLPVAILAVVAVLI